MKLANQQTPFAYTLMGRRQTVVRVGVFGGTDFVTVLHCQRSADNDQRVTDFSGLAKENERE